MSKLKGFIVLLVILLSLSLLLSCMKPLIPNEPKTLRILGWELDIQEYKSHFELAHENVEIEIMDLDQFYAEAHMKGYSGVESIEAFVAQKILETVKSPNPPDVLHLRDEFMALLIGEMQLLPLDVFIERDRFDIQSNALIVLNGINKMGKGRIYVLSPTFDTWVLYYNKDFFDKMSVPYPHDNMTWDQVFNMARQLHYEENGETYYGFTFPHNGKPFDTISPYYESMNLSILDNDYASVQVNTSKWEEVWTTMIDLQKDRAIGPIFDMMTSNDHFSVFDRWSFITGNSAMTISGYQMGHDIITQTRSGIRHNFGNGWVSFQPYDWDIVSLPTGSLAREAESNLSFGRLMGINVHSHQAALAWDYISFMNSEQMSKIQARKSWKLMSRFEHTKHYSGMDINLNAFIYTKTSFNMSKIEFMRKYPNQSIDEIKWIGREEYQMVLDGEKTVKEALTDFQMRGQEVLDRIIEETSKKP